MRARWLRPNGVSLVSENFPRTCFLILVTENTLCFTSCSVRCEVVSLPSERVVSVCVWKWERETDGGRVRNARMFLIHAAWRCRNVSGTIPTFVFLLRLTTLTNPDARRECNPFRTVFKICYHFWTCLRKEILVCDLSDCVYSQWAGLIKNDDVIMAQLTRWREEAMLNGGRRVRCVFLTAVPTWRDSQESKSETETLNIAP